MVEKVIVVGSGPSAYQAILYLKDLDPLLIEGSVVGDVGPGGQLTLTTDVDNYPCIIHTDGYELTQKFKEHCNLKDEKIINETVEEISKENSIFILKTNKNSIFKSYSVFIVTGSSAKRLNVKGSDEFWMKGISACAVCDGFFFKNKSVAVVGGGDSAMEEVKYLSNMCEKVFLIHRRNNFRSRKDQLEKVRQIKNVQLITPFVISEIVNEENRDLEIINPEYINQNSDNKLKGLILENVNSNEKKYLKVDGLFYAIGHNPNTWFLKDLDIEYEEGYIKTDKFMHTGIPGLFASGDVQDRIYKQANTAAASGCIAAFSIKKYLIGKKYI